MSPPAAHGIRRVRYTALTVLLLSGLTSCDVVAQICLPIPACPGRGLQIPDGGQQPFLTREFGCDFVGSGMSADGCGEGEAAVPFFLPEEVHQVGGIVGEYIYTGEVFTNAHGGVNTNGATRYRGNLDLVLTADTEALDLWSGGMLFVYGNQFHGRTLSLTDVGDVQFYSNIEGDPRPASTFQVTEYWYQHAFADGDITVKFGKQDANADFGFVDLGGDFLNSSFGLIPTVPLPTWPNPGMGVATFVDLTEELHIKAGVYDGAPTTGPSTGGRSGFDTLGEYGAMTLYEVLLTPAFGSEGELPGSYRVGGWYHSDDFEDLRFGAPAMKSGNYGLYVGVDQLLWKEPCSPEESQGLGAFFQYGWAPSDRNEVTQYYGAGLTYQGAIPTREEDLLGVGLALARFRDPTLQSERALELFYKTQITPWASIQPDMQYIANPAGNIQDALVIGIRSEVVF